MSFQKQTFLKKDQPRSIVHKLKTEEVTVTVLDETGNEVQVDVAIESDNKVTLTSPVEYRSVTVIVNGRIPKGENPMVFVYENSVRMLTGVRS